MLIDQCSTLSSCPQWAGTKQQRCWLGKKSPRTPMGGRRGNSLWPLREPLYLRWCALLRLRVQPVVGR
eukprot:1486543-Pyramimonas_sp.AAC.1